MRVVEGADPYGATSFPLPVILSKRSAPKDPSPTVGRFLAPAEIYRNKPPIQPPPATEPPPVILSKRSAPKDPSPTVGRELFSHPMLRIQHS